MCWRRGCLAVKNWARAWTTTQHWDDPPVDIAVLSVISSGLVGLAGVGAAIWNSFQAARIAREGRIEQRRADAYMEVLRLAELESQYYDTRVVNLVIDAQEHYPGIKSQLAVREVPPVDSRAMMAAQISAFGSTDVYSAFVSGATAWTWSGASIKRLAFTGSRRSAATGRWRWSG
jgi:hypothetical protein